MRVRAIYISLGHNYFGHYGKPAGQHPIQNKREVKCVAGRGIEGDRFFDHKDDYKGQITFFDWEVYQDLQERLSIYDKDPGVFRRNVIVEGQDLNELIGKSFELQGIHFEGICECSPCFWMNEAFGEGAETLLKERGGLRAKIVTDGMLKVDE